MALVDPDLGQSHEHDVVASATKPAIQRRPAHGVRAAVFVIQVELQRLPLSTTAISAAIVGKLTLKTGRAKRRFCGCSVNIGCSYHPLARIPDGQIVATQLGLRSTTWKFTPDRK